MKTIIISIGNSDNKLSQLEWSTFVRRIDSLVGAYQRRRHFFGGSENWQPWQNVAWWVECDEDDARILKRRLTETKVKFQQDSIAWLSGEAELI